MLQKLKNKSEGFTIIEVLIVLAIAGLIILIVFLAVPALQRNSRNTQRRNDVATYLGAINEWSNNNNGQVPASADDVTEVNDLAKLGTTYDAPTSMATGAQDDDVEVDEFVPVTGAKCDPDNVGNTVDGPTRSFAVRFAVEASNGDPVPQCQEG